MTTPVVSTASRGGSKKYWKIILGVVVFAILAAAIIGLVISLASDDEKAGDPPAGAPLSPTQTSGLAVTMVASESACKGQDADGNVPLDIQVLNHAAELKFGDSYGVSIQGLTPVDGVNKHLEWNCKDPFMAVADAYGWAHFPIGDGKTVADIPGNEWLAPFKGDPATVVDSKLFPNTKLTAAQSFAYDNFLPTWGLTGSLTEDQKKSYHTANVAFQELAGKINTLTRRLLIDPNIQSPTSVWSLHVPNHGLGIVPSLEVAKPEHLEAIVLTVKPDKGEELPCDTARIGFNVWDQRFEIFEGNCEKAPAPSAVPVGSEVPGTTTQAPPPPAPPVVPPTEYPPTTPPTEYPPTTPPTEYPPTTPPTETWGKGPNETVESGAPQASVTSSAAAPIVPSTLAPPTRVTVLPESGGQPVAVATQATPVPSNVDRAGANASRDQSIAPTHTDGSGGTTTTTTAREGNIGGPPPE